MHTVYLRVWFCGEAEDQEKHHRCQIEEHRVPHVDVTAEDGLHGAHDHQEHGGRRQHGRHEQHALVHDVQHGDVLVDFHRLRAVLEKVDDVREGRGHPAAPLVIELVESFRGIGHGVGGRRVLHTVALL